MVRGLTSLIVLGFLAAAIVFLVDLLLGAPVSGQHLYSATLYWVAGFCCAHLFFMLLAILPPFRQGAFRLLGDAWVVPVAGAWSLGFMMTFQMWGWAALIPALAFGGIGPIPAGFIASLAHGSWLSAVLIAVGLPITWISKVCGMMTGETDSHEGARA